MVMDTIQIRLTGEQIEVLQSLVASGIYPSKSEAVRDAVRKYIRAWELGMPPEEIKAAEKNVQATFVKEINQEIKEQKKGFQKVKGTIDFYPEEYSVQNAIFSSLKNTARKFNFQEIDTPMLETFELLSAKSGPEIREQIFTIERKGGEDLALRFEFTASYARMFIERQKELPKPVKWFSINRVWRYERPQAGRLREFFQFNTELYGSDKPEADAEVINCAVESLRNLGLKNQDYQVKINNRKLLNGILSDLDKNSVDEVSRIIDKASKLNESELSEMLKKATKKADEVLALTKIKGNFSECLPELENYAKNELAKEGLDELKKVFEFIDNDVCIFDMSIVRGLAYYTGTVFEIFDKEMKYRAIAGGGRYDKMIESFGGEPTPATGFGMGYATLSLLLKEKGLEPKPDLSPDYYVIYFNDVKKEALELIQKLRKNNVVETDLMQRKFGKQMEYANSIKAKKLIVIGENEVKERNIKIKDMNSGKEEIKKWNEVQ